MIGGSFLFPSDNSQSLTAVDHLVDQLVAAILPVNGPGNGLVRGKGKLGSLEMDAGAGPHRILSEQSLEAIGDIGQTDRLFDQIYLEQSVIQLYVLLRQLDAADGQGVAHHAEVKVILQNLTIVFYFKMVGGRW